MPTLLRHLSICQAPLGSVVPLALATDSTLLVRAPGRPLAGLAQAAGQIGDLMPSVRGRPAQAERCPGHFPDPAATAAPTGD